MSSVEAIKSFVRREGRMTTAQKQALVRLLPQYSFSLEQAVDLNQIFQRDHPKILEIGFGDGVAFLEMVARYPEQDFIGVEVYRCGVGRSLLALEQTGLDNVRIICDDAQTLLDRLSDQVLTRVQIFFPDPWPKRRHHKRRLIQAPFIEKIAQKLKYHGELHIVTDCADYAQQVSQLIEQNAQFINLAGANRFSSRPAYRSITKFEKKAHRLGDHSFELRAARLDGV